MTIFFRVFTFVWAGLWIWAAIKGDTSQALALFALIIISGHIGFDYHAKK